MAARGTIVRPVSFELPVLQIPFEQLYSTMQQYQLEKDTFDQFKGMMPNYLKEDSPYAQQYRQMVSDMSDTVSKQFAEGKSSQAMRALRMAQGEMKRHWQPGGIAHGLQQRYVAAQEAVKKIEEHTKDFKNPDYRDFYQYQLQEQINKGMGYDPVSGAYNPISTPQMQAEVIVGEELDKFLSGWKPDKNTSIYKGPDGFWYTKETNERVSADELRRATSEFMRQPHIQYANSVSSWASSKNIPEPIRQELTLQYRKDMHAQLDQAITQQRQSYLSLEKAVNSGKRDSVLQAQKELNRMGYQLSEDGIAGDKTKAALAQAKQEIEGELAQLEQQGRSNIDQLGFSQLQMQKTEQRLTDQYVPKHAYTARDLDLIANQPALIMLKHRLQKEALSGLKAILAPPTNTLWVPQSTSPIEFSSIADGYRTAKKSYDQLEASHVASLSPEWQQQLKQVGPNAAVAANKMANAVQAAMVKGYFNADTYEKALKQQGVNLTPVELGKNIKLVTGARGRELVQSLSDELTPAYNQTEVYKESYHQLVDQALKSKDVDWDRVAETGGIVTQKSDPNRIGGIVTPVYDGQKAKELFQQGDPKAIKAFNTWLEKQPMALKGKLADGVRENYAFMNKALEGFQGQVEEAVKASPASFFNYNVMTEKERKSLGLDKRGAQIINPKTGKPSVQIEHVGLGTTMVNGVSHPAVMVKTSAMSSPVPVSMDRLNTQWVQTMLKNGAAAAIDPHNPSNVTDPTSFNTFAAMLFDVEQKPGTAFDAQVIMTKMRSPGSVGMTYVRTPQGVTPIQSFVVKGPEGMYLYTTSSQAEAERYQKNPSVENTDILDKGEGVAVPLGQDYNSVNQAILSTKAYLNTPILLDDFKNNPYQLQLQRNNVTTNGAEVLEPFMQFIMSANE